MPAAPLKPTWSSASFVLYFGGFVVLFAVVWLLGVLADEHGAALFTLLSAVVLAAVGAIAFGLLARERELAAGVLAVVTVVAFGVFVASVLDLIGLLDEDDLGGVDLGRLLTELAVIAGALFLLGRFRFPLLVLVAAGAGWVLLADLLTDGGDSLAVLSLFVGLVYAGIGSAVARPYGMWLHLLAGVLVLGGLLNFLSDGDVDWILILLIGVAYVFIGDGIGRSSYAVIGTFAMFVAATRFIEKWWELPDPFAVVFGGEQPDVGGVGRPLTYAALGLAFVAIGLVLEGRRRPPRPVEAPPAP